MPVAQPNNLVASEPKAFRAVINEHKVVTRPVHFGELQNHARHCIGQGPKFKVQSPAAVGAWQVSNGGRDSAASRASRVEWA